MGRVLFSAAVQRPHHPKHTSTRDRLQATSRRAAEKGALDLRASPQVMLQSLQSGVARRQ
jgi:hypothetical protein